MKKSQLVISLLICLLIPSTVLALESISDCMSSTKHDSVTYLLIDRSDKLEDTRNLSQSLSIAKDLIQPGERLLVGVSTGKASETRVVMDIVRPKKSLWVSKLKIRAGEKKFNDCFTQLSTAVVKQDEQYESSALIETLAVVAKALETDSSKSKRVIVYSDMIQNSATISFYSKASIKAESMLAQVEKKGLISSFYGVQFHIAGAGVGVSDAKARSVEEFWKQYFEKCGASLKFYGPVLFAS